MAMFNLPRPVRCCLVVLLAPVVMGAAKFNYGMEIRDEDHVRSTFVYGVSRADLEEAGKKLSDFSDCDKTFDVSASDKQHGAKAEFVRGQGIRWLQIHDDHHCR
jgi:hypothetical protein